MDGEVQEIREVESRQFDYPVARKAAVVDDFHGVKIADPYRWLEDAHSDETKTWSDAQNAITRKFLDIPKREEIKKRLTELWNYPKYTVPEKAGGRYFYTKNDGLQNQNVIYMQRSLDDEASVIIDPNKLSDDGTVAVSYQEYSKDGKYLAYALSLSGSDWQSIKIRKIDDGDDFDEVLEHCKFTSVAWMADSSGFFYNSFPAPGTVPEEDQYNYNRLFWHQLGTPQSDDRMVYEHPEEKDFLLIPGMSEDGKYLIISVHKGTDPKNRVYYREVEGDGEFVRLLDESDASYHFMDNVGSMFYFLTDLDASRRRVIAIDIEHPERENWKEIIPEKDDTLQYAAIVNGRIVALWLHHAYNKLERFDLDGNSLGGIELPGIGSIMDFWGRHDDSEMFFGYMSFLYPLTIFRYDFNSDKVTTFHDIELDFDPSGYETKQVFYNSKDGTRVPMFITHKKDIELDGNNPTLLYGYGGFNISMSPHFSIGRLLWMENGGIYAVANLRGGGEYGKEWHQAGTLERKQNVFDDFIAAGEWLIENKYTVQSKLAINGGSNGGLLVGAAMVQRPDLFGAVVCQVPVLDMLRFQKFTIGRYWVSDYGNAEDGIEQLRYLLAYSPLHNVKTGIVYPPLIIATADTDDRVDPAHAKKFAATLHASDTAGINPLLIRIEMKAGHGMGKPTTKLIDEASDIYAFLFKVMAME